MEPLGNRDLSEKELECLLREWKTPNAPGALRGRIFPRRSQVFRNILRSWWRQFWRASIRIPVPVACCLAVLLAIAWWKSPGIQQRARLMADTPKFQPVLELQPRIVKASDVEN
jgi:hypothetical protein